MHAFFKELFQYNNHFNQKMIGAVIENSGNLSDKAVSLLNHILNSHQIWNTRIEPGMPSFAVWKIHLLDKLKEIDQANYSKTIGILSRVDLNTTFEYTNSKGQAFKNTVRDTLFHVINHSTHHRAQLAYEFRTAGLEPLTTDYIFYKR